jgi:hypothetical protein
MTTTRVLSSLVIALALTGCGSDESHKTAPPPPVAQKPAAPTPIGAGATAGCIGNWTSGTTSGTLVCSGADKPFDKAAFRLDRLCVNDPRITSYTAGGKTVTLTLQPDGGFHCANLGGVAEVPETCSCVAPAAGDCNPPAGGFTCAAFGHSARAGG